MHMRLALDPFSISMINRKSNFTNTTFSFSFYNRYMAYSKKSFLKTLSGQGRRATTSLVSNC